MFALALLAALSLAPSDLAAVGIIVGSRADQGIAILRSGGRSRVVGIGESAFGGRVAGIAAGRVTLEFADGPRELRLAQAAAASAEMAAAPAPPAERSLESAPDDAPREMERQEVERRLGSEIPRILAETAILPATDGSRTVGFTLTRMPEGSLLTDVGLRPGDVLTHVNDVPIDSLPTLIGLWSRLQSASTVRAQVLRNGQPLALTINLR
jgi:type II secretion system protein C